MAWERRCGLVEVAALARNPLPLAVFNGDGVPDAVFEDFTQVPHQLLIASGAGSGDTFVFQTPVQIGLAHDGVVGAPQITRVGPGRSLTSWAILNLGPDSLGALADLTAAAGTAPSWLQLWLQLWRNTSGYAFSQTPQP